MTIQRREITTTAAEPGDCPFCGLTPSSAFAAGEPMPMLDAGFIKCSCLGDQWINVNEEMLRRKDLAEKGKDARYDGWRQCYFEDTQGRFDQDAPLGSRERTKSRKPVSRRENVRAEQDWQGFGEEAELVQVQRLQRLDRPVNVRVSPGVVNCLQKRAARLGLTVSDVMRRLLEDHLADLDEVPKIDKNRNTARLHFLMTRHHQALFLGRKRAERCTAAELIEAVLLKESSRDA